MDRTSNVPVLHQELFDKIIENELPKPMEQANYLVRWIANESEAPGKTVRFEGFDVWSEIGAVDNEGFDLIFNYLVDEGLLKGELVSEWVYEVSLTMKGWEYFDHLRVEEKDYRKAFMAMQFGNEELNDVFEKTLKPSAKEAGFDLMKLNEKPKAGSIDDRLRVEIQNSDFVVADLTHGNNGAYWEAGYAEGLGKPVIYTCKKEVFEDEERKPHFDTNHHLTVIWNTEDLELAGKELKATIRATLPHLAKQND